MGGDHRLASEAVSRPQLEVPRMPTPLQVQEAFRSVDEMRLDDFAALFTPDGSMTFGNGEPSVGPAAIRAALAAFYVHLDGVRHELKGAWIVGDRKSTRL